MSDIDNFMTNSSRGSRACTDLTGYASRSIDPRGVVATELVVEICDRLAKAAQELDLRRPTERGLRALDVGTASPGVVHGQRTIDNLRLASDDVDDDPGEFANRDLGRVAEIHRSEDVSLRRHQPDKSIDKVAHETERTRLLAGAVDGDVPTEQRLDDEV